MKTYEVMARDALKRIRNHEAVRKDRRKRFVRIAAPVVSLCAVAALGLGVGHKGLLL